MTDHADLEALSAFLDGEAPEWASHVAACPRCRATVDALRAVQAAVSVPVEPVAAERDRAVAAALGHGGRVERRQGSKEPPPAAPAAVAAPTRQPARWLVPGSIAAVLLLVVGAAALLTRAEVSDRGGTTAARAPESAPSSAGRSPGAAGPGPPSDRGVAALAAPADLGEVPDVATLLARARPGLAARDDAVTTVPPGTGPSTLGGGAAATARTDVGTRPCEERARTGEPALGEVVYFATATRRGVPAFVLGFSTGPAPAPVTLLLLAQDGCGVLLRAAGP